MIQVVTLTKTEIGEVLAAALQSNGFKPVRNDDGTETFGVTFFGKSADDGALAIERAEIICGSSPIKVRIVPEDSDAGDIHALLRKRQEALLKRLAEMATAPVPSDNQESPAATPAAAGGGQ